MSAVASPRPVRSATSGASRPFERSNSSTRNHDRPRSASGYRGQSRQSASNSRGSGPSGNRDPNRKPDPVLFQHYFKSIGPRTYAVQIKRAQNQNPYLVITEGKRDDKTDEVRKTRVFVYGEDFDSFIDLLRHAAVWIKQHPVSDEFKQKRRQFWQKRQRGGGGRASPARGEPATLTPPASTSQVTTSGQRRPATASSRNVTAITAPKLASASPRASVPVPSGRPVPPGSPPQPASTRPTGRPIAQRVPQSTSRPSAQPSSLAQGQRGAPNAGAASRFAASRPAQIPK